MLLCKNTSNKLPNINKNHIKISIISIVLSLLFYCYQSIVKPLWLLGLVKNIRLSKVLLFSLTITTYRNIYLGTL